MITPVSGEEVYRHSDEAIKRLQTLIGRMYQNFSHKLPGWDELNVIQVKEDVDGLYEQMDHVVRRELVRIAREAKKDTDGSGVGMNLVWLAVLLTQFSPVTNYKYSSEWLRKRDRTTEGLMSSVGNSQLGRQLLKRSMNVTFRQIRQYCDIVTDEARLAAFQQMGVTRVRWVTQRDGKVCAVCKPRDNHTYNIDAVPPKHPNCRCYLIPV